MLSRGKTLKLTTTLLLVLIFGLATFGATHIVSKEDAQFSSIQAAIDFADPGDTVQIREGTYEENLSVDKELTLKGAGTFKVKIDGKKEGYPVLHLGASEAEITVKDLALQGAEGDACQDVQQGFCPDGVDAVGDSQLTVKGVIISGNGNTGIRLWDSTQVTVENSKISVNKGNGIGLYNSARVTVDKTEITGNKWASITLGGSTQATLENVKVSENGGGIWLSDSAMASVDNSKIEKNGDGLTLSGSARASVKNNIISGNKGTGILLSDSSQANVDNNEVKDNELGITLANSSRATVKKNGIKNNKFGIGLEDSAQITVQNNSIQKNDTGIKIYKPEKFKGNLEGFGNQINDNDTNFNQVPESTQEELVS